MEQLPLDKRGYPVPYVVYQENDAFYFKINDQKKSINCILNKKCSICGSDLNDDLWLVGGPQSAFHPYGVYIDSGVHYECGKYALQVCPYLSYSGYNATLDLSKLQDKVSVLLHNPTVDPNRVPCFVFIHITDYDITSSFNLKPKKPYLNIEFWNNGELLTSEEGYKLINDYNLKNNIKYE